MSRHASVSVRPTRFNLIIANIISQEDSFVGPSSSSPSYSYLELDNYLKHHFEIEQDNFNILEWWKEKSIKFLILSRIAKDSLSIPASTVASKSAFSAGKRILDDKRSRFALHTKYAFVRKIEIKQMSEHKDSRTMMIKTMMMDASASLGREVAEASNQQKEDDHDE